MTKNNEQKDFAHILVAEDNPAVRSFLVRALETTGAHVHAVENGQDAQNALKQDRYDILITDIIMPCMDGIALALKAGALYPSLRIIMLSGYPQERMRAHNLEALVHRIIAKPFSLEEICNAVFDVMALPPLRG